jgi:FlgD Ig-like domain
MMPEYGFVRFRLPALLLLLSALAVCNSRTEATTLEDRASYYLRSSVVGAAGSIGTSPNFVSRGTFGQASPTGTRYGEELTLYSGFWAPLFRIQSDVEVLHPVNFTNALFQNRPNPFRSSTVITYTVAVAANVEIQIVDVAGRRVRTLLYHHSPPGAYTVTWDGRDNTGSAAVSGVYFYQLKVDAFLSVKRMLILR